MANESSAIVQHLWNYCNVLRDDGVSYGDWIESHNAFAGKLVPQDSSDESAERLLERITSRKDAKTAKKDKK